MQTIWLSPSDYVTGDPTLKLSYPSAAHPGTTVSSTKTGDQKWVSMSLRLPEDVAIAEIIVCYRASKVVMGKQCFISQIQLKEIDTPNHATVIHNDDTDLKSTSDVCYTSALGGKTPTPGMAVSLALSLNFEVIQDEQSRPIVIALGAVGVQIHPSVEGAACVETLADLRSLDVNPGMVACVRLLGYEAPGDGGEGEFWYDAEDAGPDNGGTIIRPDSVPDSAAGRWKRPVTGVVNVKWFGAKGDGIANDLPAFEAAMESMGPVRSGQARHGTLFIPPVDFRLDDDLKVERAIKLTGTAPGSTSGKSRLIFAPYKGVRVYSSSDSPRGGDANYATLEDI